MKTYKTNKPGKKSLTKKGRKTKRIQRKGNKMGKKKGGIGIRSWNSSWKLGRERHYTTMLTSFKDNVYNWQPNTSKTEIYVGDKYDHDCMNPTLYVNEVNGTLNDFKQIVNNFDRFNHYYNIAKAKLGHQPIPVNDEPFTINAPNNIQGVCDSNKRSLDDASNKIENIQALANIIRVMITIKQSLYIDKKPPTISQLQTEAIKLLHKTGGVLPADFVAKKYGLDHYSPTEETSKPSTETSKPSTETSNTDAVNSCDNNPFIQKRFLGTGYKWTVSIPNTNDRKAIENLRAVAKYLSNDKKGYEDEYKLFNSVVMKADSYLSAQYKLSENSIFKAYNANWKCVKPE